MGVRGAGVLFLCSCLFASSGTASVPKRSATTFLDEPAAEAALSYERAREIAVALRLWESLLERYPTNADLWLRIARLRLRSLGREAVVEWSQRYRALPETQRGAMPDAEAGFRALSDVFLTDEGQTLFFTGRKRAGGGDCADAVLLFHRALKLEGPHRVVLAEKARCERQLRAFTPYYETLRELDRTAFLDVPLAEDLAEAHMLFQAPKPALDVVNRVPRLRRTPRLELAAGLAELESGEAGSAGRALEWFRATLDRVRVGKILPGAVDPLVYYGLGLAEKNARAGNAEAGAYLRRFLEEPPREDAAWDPYRRAERFEEAKRILAELGLDPSRK